MASVAVILLSAPERPTGTLALISPVMVPDIVKAAEAVVVVVSFGSMVVVLVVSFGSMVVVVSSVSMVVVVVSSGSMVVVVVSSVSMVVVVVAIKYAYFKSPLV